MRVKDVIDALLEGELNNLNMLDSNGNLKPERLKKIIDTINLGLTDLHTSCLLYTSPSPRDVEESRMPSSA